MTADTTATKTPWMSRLRPAVEFVVVLALVVLVFWEFAAKPYIVPTGSMAPTLVGRHKRLTCPDCGHTFALGVDEDGGFRPPRCPNCGQTEGFRADAQPVASGDRLLVSTACFEVRPPRRWEAAVFRNPNDPMEVYVKRVVGLPGEELQIRDGDVYVNGRIARKSLAQFRRLRMLVFDAGRRPSDPGWRPRWVAQRGTLTGWQRRKEGFVRAGHDTDDRLDWLEYRHRVRRPAGLDRAAWRHWRRHGGEVRVNDRYGYNGVDVRMPCHRVGDLGLSCDVKVTGGTGQVAIDITDGVDRFRLRLAVGEGHATLEHNQAEVQRASRSVLARDRFTCLEVVLCDARLMCAADGRAIFPTPYDYVRSPDGRPRGTSRPVAVGATGVGLGLKNLRLDRDIYYTGPLPDLGQDTIGVARPVLLGDDEYFVLGDNSPISNDSRFWTGPARLSGTLLLGKPFIVHLPSQAVNLHVFGRQYTLSLPDVMRVRLIK